MCVVVVVFSSENLILWKCNDTDERGWESVNLLGFFVDGQIKNKQKKGRIEDGRMSK